MGIVTAIADPGEFYVVRWLDIKERDQFFEQIQIIAPTCCPVTDSIVPGQMYSCSTAPTKLGAEQSLAHPAVSFKYMLL